MRNVKASLEVHEPEDDLSADKLNTVTGGWFAGWGSGTSGSGGGLVLGGISGEARDARHPSLIDI